MGRKGSIIFLSVLIGGLVVLFWFIQRGSRIIITDPYSIIPKNASVIAESADLPGLLGRITEENTIFGELAAVREAGSFTGRIVYLRDILNRKELAGLFERNKSVISFQKSGNESLVPLLSMNVPPETRYRNIYEILKTLTSGKLYEEKLGKTKIMVIPYKLMEEQDTLFVTFTSGLLISTPSRKLLANALTGKEPADDIRKAPGFSRIMGAAGKREDKIFIIFSNFSEIIGSLTGEKDRGLSKDFSRLAGSAEGDVFINNNGIILSGYTETGDSADYLFSFKSGPSGKMNSPAVLPADVLLFKTMFLPENIQPLEVKAEGSDSTGRLAAALAPFLGSEITHALLKEKGDSEMTAAITIFGLKNRDMAEKLISQTITSRGNLSLAGEGPRIEYFQPDDQTRIPVYLTGYRNLATHFAGRFSSTSNDTLITFFDNFMFIGSSFEVLSKVLYDNILNKTLDNDIAFRDFEATLPSRAAYYFYCVPFAITQYLSGVVNDSVLKIAERNSKVLRKVQAIGYQFAPSNGMIYNTLSVKFGEAKDKSGAEWETLLDTPAGIKPFFFTNHNTGAKEIFVQDTRNNCYLVNAAGRVLWKVELNERIRGEVFMIDYFGNGKYQMLFSGTNWLHLIDRNGNYVERYPVKLRSPASGPSALFDYDGSRDYRILVPGEDRYIYAYDKTGNVVKGWKPFRTNGTVTRAIKFFRVSGKDYLVASDNSTLYFLDRTGNIRLSLKEPVIRAAGSEIRMSTGKQPGLVLSSPDGTVQVAGFDGKVSKSTFGKFGSDHSFDFFDVDGDGFGEYLFIDKGILYLYDDDKSEVFSRDFGNLNIEGPINFVFSSSDRKIGIFDSKNRLIYLIDQKGNTMKGFPLRGASAFSIGKLSERSVFNLVVGGDDNFLYNYKLE